METFKTFTSNVVNYMLLGPDCKQTNYFGSLIIFHDERLNITAIYWGLNTKYPLRFTEINKNLFKKK